MPQLPPLIDLRAFEAVARHLSFKKAAEELCVTPTAISHQIRQLERYCGQSLFRRHPRPVALTEAGARLFPVVHDGFEAFGKAMASVKRGGSNQPLRLTTTNALASRWLVPRLSIWRKQPDALSLEVIGTDVVLDLRSEADVAIRSAATLPEDGVAKALFRELFLANLQSAPAFRSPSVQASGRASRPGPHPFSLAALRPECRDMAAMAHRLPDADGATCPRPTRWTT